MADDPRLNDLLLRWEELHDQGMAMSLEEYCRDCPELLEEMRRQIADLELVAPLSDMPDNGVDVVRGTNCNGPPSATVKEAQPIDLSISGYQILGELGRGGMSVVYKARQLSLQRIVALKMTLSGTHAGPLELVRAEAETIARLHNPSIVQIHEVGEQDGRPYLALEFVEGGSLAQRLNGAPQPPREAAQLVETLARAIHAAHQQGIVHRDLKPSNILLQPLGTENTEDAEKTPERSVLLSSFTPKIADFGLAKRLHVESGQTKTGDIMGTPSYMAPEQAAGKANKVGPATDVYALGAILYEMLTGRPPFLGATTSDTIMQVRHQEPVPPRRWLAQVPRDLETICLKCLQKEVGQRYTSALALAEDLYRFLAFEPILARPSPVWVRAAKWVKRHPTLATLATVSGAAVLALVALGIFYTLQLQAANAKVKQELRRAEIERAKYTFMTDLLYVTEDPISLNGCVPRVPKHVGSTLTVEEILKRGKRQHPKLLSQHPEIGAAMLEMIGNAYRTLGNYERAEIDLAEALKLREEHSDIDPQDVANSLHALGTLYHEWGRLENGDYEKARDYYARALQVRKGRLGTDSLPYCQTLFHQAWMDVELEQYREAAERFQQVIELLRQESSASAEVLMFRTQMGLAVTQLEAGGGKYDFSGLKETLAAVDNLLKLEKDDRLVQAMPYFTQGLLALEGAKTTSLLAPIAEKNLQQCKELVDESLGRRNDYSVALLFFLAEARALAGKHREAEEAYKECWERLGETAGYHHLLAPKVAAGYVRFVYKVGNPADREKAHQRFDQIIDAQKTRFGEGHYLIANTLMDYADLLQELKETDRQEEQCRKALAIYERTGGPRRRLYTHCLRSLISALEAQKKLDQAEPVKQKLAAIVK